MTQHSRQASAVKSHVTFTACSLAVVGFTCYASNSYTWLKYFSVAKNAFKTKRVSRRIIVSL